MLVSRHLEGLATPQIAAVAGTRDIVAHPWRWAFAAIISFPVAVLSHEAAHWSVARSFDFPDATLHYGSSSYTTAAAFWKHVYDGNLAFAGALHPLWQPTLVAAAGLFVSYGTIAWCCRRVFVHGATPFVVALGVIASLRFLGGVPLLLARLLGRANRPHTDESHVALITGIPEWMLLIVGFAALMYCWKYLILAIPAPNRRTRALALSAGIVVGGFLYAGWLGPLLLP